MNMLRIARRLSWYEYLSLPRVFATSLLQNILVADTFLHISCDITSGKVNNLSYACQGMIYSSSQEMRAQFAPVFC